MADPTALRTEIRDGWALTVAGIKRTRGGAGSLEGSLILENDRPVYSDRVAIDVAESRRKFAEAATAEGRPTCDEIEAASMILLPDALALEQEVRPKRSQADLMVELVSKAGVELFHDRGGNAYASFAVDGHRETHPLKHRGFRLWLRRRFHERYGKAPGSQAVQDALGVLEGIAHFDGPEIEVFVRVAEYAGKIYLDLANEHWESIAIDGEGWFVVPEPPVRFRRPKGTLPLPMPISGGSVDLLWEFVNLKERHDQVLFVAALVQAFRPSGPYPVLALQSEHGSGKSTAARVFRRLIDPNSAELRSAPREAHDLMIAASNSWVIGFDNLSRIPMWLSDALCRLSTGGGMSTRELYSDAEEMLFDAQRPVIVNGIDDIVSRADLLDRTVILTLTAISEEQRRPEAAFWRDFANVQPRVLGALLDAVSGALGNLPRVCLNKLPRMADFALWATAAESALGWEPGTFMTAYDENRSSANDVALTAVPIAGEVLDFMQERDRWDGTATELLVKLALRVDPELLGALHRAHHWPKTPQGLSSILTRLTPNLKVAGVNVAFARKSGTGQRLIQLERIGRMSSQASRSSRESAEPHANKERL